MKNRKKSYLSGWDHFAEMLTGRQSARLQEQQFALEQQVIDMLKAPKEDKPVNYKPLIFIGIGLVVAVPLIIFIIIKYSKKA